MNDLIQRAAAAFDAEIQRAAAAYQKTVEQEHARYMQALKEALETEHILTGATMIKDPHYLYPGDPGYPTGGPAVALKLAVPNPENPPGEVGTGTIGHQEFSPETLLAVRSFRAALSAYGSNTPECQAIANAMAAYPNWGAALQYAGAQGYDGLIESALYTQFGGK